MFLQETKTKRGGKTYVSYLVRESFRTPSGPRGRTICNVTHLPKAVRDLVGDALKGKPFVPLEKLQLGDLHRMGGCAVLEDAGRRYGLHSLLDPLSPRSRSLIHAMVFGGLLFPPSIAPFYLESRSTRLAMFCGLDPENERFDMADLNAALAELDAAWPRISQELLEAYRASIRAFCCFRRSASKTSGTFSVLALDASGVPVPFSIQKGSAAPVGLEAFFNRTGKQDEPLLLILDEETAAGIEPAGLAAQSCVIELTDESARRLRDSLPDPNLEVPAALELRHQGRRYILEPAFNRSEMEIGDAANVASLQDLGAMADFPPPPSPAFRAVVTTGTADSLPLSVVVEWAARAREIRNAFSPIHIVIGSSQAADEGVGAWRNHQHLQFLTHRLRCQLHAEWRAHGENRPVEEVLRDLQEIYRGTLLVDNAEVRSLAPQVSRTAADLLTKLELWHVFQAGGKC